MDILKSSLKKRSDAQKLARVWVPKDQLVINACRRGQLNTGPGQPQRLHVSHIDSLKSTAQLSKSPKFLSASRPLSELYKTLQNRFHVMIRSTKVQTKVGFLVGVSTQTGLGLREYGQCFSILVAYANEVTKLTTKECYRMQGRCFVTYLEGCFRFGKVSSQCRTVVIFYCNRVPFRFLPFLSYHVTLPRDYLYSVCTIPTLV